MVYPKPKKFYFIYRTIRLDTGQFYVGLHSTDDLEDGYLGSGHRLKAAVKKHGKEKFVREIVEMLPDYESLCAKEKEIVTENMLKDPLCLNIKKGGQCPPTEEANLRRSISLTGKKRVVRHRQPLSEKTKQKISVSHKGKILSSEHRESISETLKGRVFSEEHRQRLREHAARRVRVNGAFQ